MVKNLLFIVLLSIGLQQEYAGHNFMNTNDVKKTDITWNTQKNEESSCVTYSIHYNDDFQTYLVDFMNQCNKTVNITYQYYSESSGKWLTSYTSCRAGKKSFDNPAGKSGKVKNVEYEFI